jgi:hypothetical protein
MILKHNERNGQKLITEQTTNLGTSIKSTAFFLHNMAQKHLEAGTHKSVGHFLQISVIIIFY